MRRRIFSFASLLSLLLWLVTAAVWIRSNYHHDSKRVGDFFAISSDGSVLVAHFVPDGVKDLEFFYWKWTLLFSVLPVLWIFIWWLKRRQPREGRCRTCHYDLTGNTSGTCPECGSPIRKRPGLPGVW